MRRTLSYIGLFTTVIGVLMMAGCKPKPEPEPEQVDFKVKVEPSSVELYRGESVQLIPSVTPSLEVEYTFSSDEEDIATVSKKGLVTAQDSLGSAVITIVATIGDEKRKTRCHVDVVPDKLMLNVDTLALFPLDTYTLHVKLDNAGTDVTSECNWESSDDDVAIVSGGVVSAVAEGECEITARYMERSVVCHVCVSPTLMITPASAAMMIGTTKQFTVNAYGATFKSNNELVATVSALGLVMAVAKGVATITATVGSRTVSASVTVSDELQISLNGHAITSTIYACPGDTLLFETNVEADASWSVSGSVAQVDEMGRLIAMKEGNCTVTVTCGTVKASADVTIVNGFKIGPNSVTMFANTNIYYNTDRYYFHKYVWDKGGTRNSQITIEEYPYTDLFGWGTGNKPNKYSNSYSDYSTFVDWGNNVIYYNGNTTSDPAGTWRTLTAEEWEYLFIKRPNANELFAFASVNGHPGLIILPNNWVKPDGIFYTPATSRMERKSDNRYVQIGYDSSNKSTYTYSQNTYNDDKWDTMVASGAVFLPAAGYRVGTTVTSPSICYKGYYWSSTSKDSQNAYCIKFTEEELCWHQTATRDCGYAVRLGRNITD